MDKRGRAEEISLYSTFELGLFVIVIMGLLALTMNFDYVSRANEVYTEKDLTLMVNVIDSSPGNIEYEYPLKDAYTTEIEENRINIIRDPNSVAEFYSEENLIIKKQQNQDLILT